MLVEIDTEYFCEPDSSCCVAMARHKIDGRHWHSCPKCFETWECFDGCDVEHDLSGPLAMSNHWECLECRDRLEYQFRLGGYA